MLKGASGQLPHRKSPLSPTPTPWILPHQIFTEFLAGNTLDDALCERGHGLAGVVVCVVRVVVSVVSVVVGVRE